MALRISIPMPPRLTHYVLAAAVDHGSVYWLRDYARRYQWGRDQDLIALHIGAPMDHMPANTECVSYNRIGAARIARALELMFACGNHVHAERAGRVIAGNFDAPDADVVLQFAAFGEVIYG